MTSLFRLLLEPIWRYLIHFIKKWTGEKFSTRSRGPGLFFLKSVGDRWPKNFNYRNEVVLDNSWSGDSNKKRDEWWQNWRNINSLQKWPLRKFCRKTSVTRKIIQENRLRMSYVESFAFPMRRSVDFRMTFWFLKFSEKPTKKFDDFLP